MRATVCCGLDSEYIYIIICDFSLRRFDSRIFGNWVDDSS
jgi:hypothetical protein